MKSAEIRNLSRTALWFVPTALAAGVVNGLLGAGGGVIMLYLVRVMLNSSKDETSAGKDAFASVVAIMLPVSMASAVSYALRGSFDVAEMRILAIPALVGGIAGAYLTDKLPVNVIKGIFALLVVISGIRMMM